MAYRRFLILVLVVWFAALGVGVYWLQDHEIAKLQYQRPFRDTLNLPLIIDSKGQEVGEEGLPKLGKVMALGYDQMFASILWLRVIQAFGAKLQHVRENPRELHAIENLFWTVTELDPRFIEAYKFGNFILGDEGGNQEAALRLLDRGIVRNYKRTYILPYEAIFICLTDLQDYDRARYYLRQTLRTRDCPPYVKRIENYIDARKGNYEIALERWVRDYLDARFRHETQLYEVTRMQMNNIINEWHLSIIEAAMDRYFERHEDYPARLEQLEEQDVVGKVRQVSGPVLATLLARAEADRVPPNRAVDVIMGATDFPGCIIESNRLPRDLRGEPYLLAETAVVPLQKRPLVVERDRARKQTELALHAIRRRIEGYRKVHGDYPARLEDLPEMQLGSPEELPRKEPIGMPWKYDPKAGKISSYTFPEL
ncbi:hypothetical protein AMJ85_04390 [candidate division BRC1 bacterium SM23_51]|nr:MAG: hypothetical protein AMJ85_04390 [candidate division BRC1 bacterium SM23_51]